MFAALSVLSAACGGSFDQSLVHALLGHEQTVSRAALHRLHGERAVILLSVGIASIVVMKIFRLNLCQARASST